MTLWIKIWGSPHPLRESVAAARLGLVLLVPHMGEGRREKQDFVVRRRWKRGRQIQDQSQTWIFVLKQGHLEMWVACVNYTKFCELH